MVNMDGLLSGTSPSASPTANRVTSSTQRQPVATSTSTTDDLLLDNDDTSPLDASKMLEAALQQMDGIISGKL